RSIMRPGEGTLVSFSDSTGFRPRGFGQQMSTGPAPLVTSRLHPPHPNMPFRPLPPPTGRSPFHLSLSDVLPPAMISEIMQARRIAFHVMGDCGGIKFPEPQQIVADHIERDVLQSPGGNRAIPAFLYVLGDVVYYFGAASEYRNQFYEP